MRALITGALGFVGRHLTEHLRSAGDEVLGTALRAEADRLIEWDVGRPASDGVLRRMAEFAPDVVFHLAAISIPRDCGDAEPTPEAVRVNVDGVRHVLAAVQSLPRPPRVVFMSSGHVYAAGGPAAPPVVETQPLAPRSAYGKTKLAAEEICRNSGAEYVIIRSFPMSGPGQDGRLMLAEWVDQCLRRDAPAVQVLSLDVTIDFLDVRDGVRALRAIALRGAAGEVYNLGSGTPRTTGEVFRLLQEQTGERRPVVELRPGRRSDPIADVGRLRAATGWTPEIPPARTVADVLEDRRNRS